MLQIGISRPREQRREPATERIQRGLVQRLQNQPAVELPLDLITLRLSQRFLQRTPALEVELLNARTRNVGSRGAASGGAHVAQRYRHRATTGEVLPRGSVRR